MRRGGRARRERRRRDAAPRRTGWPGGARADSQQEAVEGNSGGNEEREASATHFSRIFLTRAFKLPAESTITGSAFRASRLVASFQRQNERLGVSPSCSASSFTAMDMSGMLFSFFRWRPLRRYITAGCIRDASGVTDVTDNLPYGKSTTSAVPFTLD